MTVFETTRRVPYTAAQMYALVLDIEAYSEFMPLCSGSHVTSRRQLDGGREELIAVLHVAHARTGIRGSFESTVTADPAACTIAAESSTGLIKRLHNEWQFRDRPGGGSVILFSIEYRLRSWALQTLLTSLYDRAFEAITRAFLERARIIYGTVDRASA